MPFNNPETLQKAIEKSKATRAAKKAAQLSVFDTPEATQLPQDEPMASMADLPERTHGIDVYANCVGSDGKFKPTKNMWQVLRLACDLESGDQISTWFTKLGLSRSLWYQWRDIPGFREWWQSEFDKAMLEQRTSWMRIGLRQMSTSYKHWAFMGERLFKFVEEIAVKEVRSEEEQKLLEELTRFFVSDKKLSLAKIIDAQGTVVIDEKTTDPIALLTHDLEEA